MTRQKIVFIGDSITEWGRFEDPEGMGDNYVRLIRDQLATQHHETPEIINKGIGGNRITDLKERFDQDVIQLNPDLVSISIGVNDVWRQLDSEDLDQVTPERYESIYHELLQAVQSQTKAKIVLMEPTIIEEDVLAEGNQRMKAYVEIVRQLSATYDATLVKTYEAFIDYLHKGTNLPLTTDGVHMTSTGNQLMAQTWLRDARK